MSSTRVKRRRLEDRARTKELQECILQHQKKEEKRLWWQNFMYKWSCHMFGMRHEVSRLDY
jgi:hypothetical protein